MYVFSAKGAAFIVTAWGSAPGTDSFKKRSAESAIQAGNPLIYHFLSRAFSAPFAMRLQSLGRLPQADITAALLAR